MNDLKHTLASAPLDDGERQAAFEAELRQRGMAPEIIEIVTRGGETLPAANVRVSVPGRSQLDQPVYVTAHHDCVKAGRGIVDNWSGVVALVELAERFLQYPLNRPVRLVSFAYEETGPYGFAIGSEHYLRVHCRDSAFANVNLECLGPSPLHYWTYDARLTPAGIPESRFWGVPSDAVRFQQYGHPSITFDGISACSRQVIHTQWDNIDAIDMDHYRRSLDQIEVYLRILDGHNRGGMDQSASPTYAPLCDRSYALGA